MRLPIENPLSESTALESTAQSITSAEREDLHLAERVERALRATGYGALRHIRVTVRARLVTLAGPVPSYHLKQLAQATALTVPGAHHVANDLNVCRPP